MTKRVFRCFLLSCVLSLASCFPFPWSRTACIPLCSPVEYSTTPCRGSSPVERGPEKAGVGSSTLPPGTTTTSVSLAQMNSKFVRGLYISGYKHSRLRPRFYESLGLWQGTINIQLPRETDESLIIPIERRAGLDPIDLESNQDFLIRACRLKGVEGFQVLPVDKTTSEPRGHHSSRIIEISLKNEIEITPNEELEVELKGFEN